MSMRYDKKNKVRRKQIVEARIEEMARINEKENRSLFSRIKSIFKPKGGK